MLCLQLDISVFRFCNTMDIMKKNILTIAGFILSLGVSDAQQTTKQPNIILIMADDLGWGDVGFNGNKIIRTPVLDKLASEGVKMERFYSAGPLSSPTRASVLIGRHPFRTGVFSANEGILRPEEITLPELLKAAGYQTSHFGKWHLGTLTATETDANRGRPENKHLYNPPVLHGYDVAFVTESKVPTFDPMVTPRENNGRFWDYMQEYELYDIEDDPNEKYNLAKQLPDITKRLCKVLSIQLESYESSFFGKEYGRESYDKVGQDWWNITKQ